MTEADDAYRYAQDRFVHERGAFVAPAQTLEARGAIEGALDYPAVGT